MQASLLSTMMGLAAVMLALAVLVQIMQEVYKYLSDSKARAYTGTLLDFLGPWATQLLRPGTLLTLQIRGPLQFRRFRPPDRLLPMSRQELTEALASTAPSWVGRTLEQLEMEVALQQGQPSRPSPTWHAFLRELGSQERGTPGYWNAYEVARFLENYRHELHARQASEPTDEHDAQPLGGLEVPEIMDAGEMLVAFKQQFLPHVVRATTHFAQLERNFEYAYRRRNLRQTFTISLIVAFLFNLPLQRLYDEARALSPADAAALVEKSMALYEKGSGGEALKQWLDEVQQVLPQAAGSRIGLLPGAVFRDPQTQSWSWAKAAAYLLGCLFTSLLVSFGAPFWNDLASALLRLQRGTRREPQPGNGGMVDG